MLDRAALRRMKVLTGKLRGTEDAAWNQGELNWEAAGMNRTTMKK